MVFFRKCTIQSWTCTCNGLVRHKSKFSAYYTHIRVKFLTKIYYEHDACQPGDGLLDLSLRASLFLHGIDHVLINREINTTAHQKLLAMLLGS